jgi:hypothetical protein
VTSLHERHGIDIRDDDHQMRYADARQGGLPFSFD